MVVAGGVMEFRVFRLKDKGALNRKRVVYVMRNYDD